jgi:hypothetical protein
MQFKAKDGSSHPSQMAAFQAGSKPAPDDQPKSIMDDPEAMKLVDQLKQMGYGPEDVEQAMGGSDQDNAAAPAPLSIPGM